MISKATEILGGDGDLAEWFVRTCLLGLALEMNIASQFVN